MYRRPKPEPKYQTEAALCDDLRTHAKAAGWLVYPECGGWDLVLVRRGIQIGVQAKLKFNPHLVAQALASPTHGPHYRALACPLARTVRDDAYMIAERCGLLLLDMNAVPDRWLVGRMRWSGIRLRDTRSWRRYRWPGKRLWLPPAVPDLPAGVPSPEVVGPWQLAVCEAEALIRRKGWIAKADLYPIIKAVGARCRAETILTRYYLCTGTRLGPDTRACKWVPYPRRRPASKRYPAAWGMVTCAARNPATGSRCHLRPGHRGRHRS
jgi:hypothetical protein